MTLAPVDLRAQPRLTEMSPAGGCAAKMCSAELRTVLDRSGVNETITDRVVVGSRHSDDAAVVRLSGGLTALTIDFMPPVVDDVETWAKVVVANVTSDLYAEGADPILALAMLVWPAELSLDLAALLLQTTREALNELGADLVGGHTIVGPSPLFGMAAIGDLGGRQPTLNSTAVAGDALVLTKAVGTGFAVTATKLGICPGTLYDAAAASMTTVNFAAAQAARTWGASAVTDVTGFGLIGHALEMANASAVTIELWAGAVPRLPGVGDLIEAGIETGGGSRNRRDLMPYSISFVTLEDEKLLCDPQTSGGLLVALEPGAASRLVAELGGSAAIVGRVLEKSSSKMIVKEG